MRIQDFYSALQEIIPEQAAESFDRVGIQLLIPPFEVRALLLTMEVTDEVVEEAVHIGANVILSFHPLIFPAIERVHVDERVGRILQKLIRNNISLVVAHTNVDSYARGTNWKLAQILGLQNISFLVPHPSLEDFGMGIVGFFIPEITLSALLNRLYNRLNCSLRYTTGKTDLISKVAIVAGAGRSYLEEALRAGVDAFITADLKYHDFHAAKGRIALIECGHYEMEQFVPEILEEIVLKIPHRNFPIYRSKQLPNPVSYYPDDNFREKQMKVLIDKEGDFL